jgi:hypothetical protein
MELDDTPREMIPGLGALVLYMQAGLARAYIYDDGDRLGWAWVGVEHEHQCPDAVGPHTHLFVKFVYGRSALHKRLLEWLCEQLIADGLGDTLVSYVRSGKPLTVLADNVAVARDEIRGPRATTTARKALARLRA